LIIANENQNIKIVEDQILQMVYEYEIKNFLANKVNNKTSDLLIHNKNSTELNLHFGNITDNSNYAHSLYFFDIAYELSQ